MLPAKASPNALMTLADFGCATTVVTSATVTMAPMTLNSLSAFTVYFPHLPLVLDGYVTCELSELRTVPRALVVVRFPQRIGSVLLLGLSPRPVGLTTHLASLSNPARV